tara:strand:- start:459 stop:716 length:258 start_codon:yes stop_codon:yes gene_type:complete
VTLILDIHSNRHLRGDINNSMTTELVLIHIGYVIALVYFVYRSGAKQGRKEIIADFLDRGLVKEDDLHREYLWDRVKDDVFKDQD